MSRQWPTSALITLLEVVSSLFIPATAATVSATLLLPLLNSTAVSSSRLEESVEPCDTSRMDSDISVTAVAT